MSLLGHRTSVITDAYKVDHRLHVDDSVAVEEDEVEIDEFDEEAEDALVEGARTILQQLRNSGDDGDTDDHRTDKENLDKEMLIEAVRPYPIIWNAKHPNHKDNTKKKIIWLKIQREMFKDRDIETLKSVWKNLKDGWTRCQTKINRLALKTGSKATGKRPTCLYYDQLVFLGNDNLETSLSTTPTSISTTPGNSNSSGTSSETPAKPPYRESFKRQKPNSKSDPIEKEILNSLKNVNDQINQQQPQEPVPQKEESPNMHFCKSLVPLLDKRTPEQNMLARIKIQQVVYEIQFNKSL